MHASVPTVGASAADLDAGLKRQLLDIVQTAPTVAAGNISLIGLEALRERLGARWDQVSDRVGALTERLLKQLLDPRDVWFRHGSENYVVVFADRRKADAQLICAKVVEQLQMLLLGDSDAKSIVVRTVVGEADGSVLLESVNLGSLLESAAHACTTRETDVRAAAMVRLMQKQQQGGPVELSYRPIWDYRHQVVSIFMVRASRRLSDTTAAWGYDILSDPDDADSILDLDLEVLSRAVETFQELYENRFRFILSLPLHFESLAVLGRRRQTVQLLRCIPRHLQSLLIFQLISLPDGIPLGRLADLASAVRPFSRAVMAMGDFATLDHQTFASAGLHGVGAVLPPRGDHQRSVRDLQRFRSSARKHRLECFVDGIDAPALEEAAQRVEVDYHGGAIIGAWSPVPQHMQRRARSELMGSV